MTNKTDTKHTDVRLCTRTHLHHYHITYARAILYMYHDQFAVGLVIIALHYITFAGSFRITFNRFNKTLLCYQTQLPNIT